MKVSFHEYIPIFGLKVRYQDEFSVDNLLCHTLRSMKNTSLWPIVEKWHKICGNVKYLRSISDFQNTETAKIHKRQ